MIGLNRQAHVATNLILICCKLQPGEPSANELCFHNHETE